MALDFLSGIINAASGALGAGAGKGDMATAEEMITANLRDAQNLSLPDYQKLMRQYALLQAGKEYTPEKLAAEQMRTDYLNQVQADPEMMAKQRQYMDYLDQVAQQGMTPDEAAQRNALLRQMEGAAQSKVADIQRQDEMRGMGSSGANLVAKMMAQQQAQNVGSEEADRIAAQMFKRKMGAQGSLAQQASDLDKLQYQRALAKAENLQALDKFNLGQRADAARYNVDSANAAQRANIARQQQVSDKNVGILNTQQDYNKELENQRFEDALRKQGIVASARTAESGMRQQRAGRTAQEIAGAGKALTGALDYGMNKYNQQQAWDNRSGEEIDADVAAGKKRPSWWD